MRLLCGLFIVIFSHYINAMDREEEADHLLIDFSTPIEMDVKPDKALFALNHYYCGKAHNFMSWQEKIEKSASAAVASTGMICLYFLGAELVNDALGRNDIGYILGPLFELPAACIAYQAQNALVEQVKQSCNADWRSLKTKDRNCLKNLAKKGCGGVAGGLGFISSFVAIYYTDYYLEPMIGDYVWFFIVPACITNTLIASLGSLSLLDFFSSNLTRYVFKGCAGETFSQKEEIKRVLTAIIARMEKGEEIEARADVQDIQEHNLVAMIAEKNISLQKVHDLKHSSRCGEKAKVAFGGLGALIASIGSIAMVPATLSATQFILESWCGVDSSTALPISAACGLLGGITVAGYRGNSNKTTFQRMYDLIGGCRKKTPSEASSACTGIKTLASETLTWATSIAAVAPRVQIILYSMEQGPLRDVIVGCNIIATACNDYFGWKKFPDNIKDYFFIKNDKDKVLSILKALNNDIDSLSEEVINSLYVKLCHKSEDLSPIESVPDDIGMLKKSIIDELQTVLNDG